MKNFFSAFALTVPLLLTFSFTPEAALNCPPPQNVSTTSLNGGNITFDWDNCPGGCAAYLVRYYRAEDQFSSGEYSTSSSAISFSSLPDGTYDFYFVTACNSEISSSIIIQETIQN